MRQFDVLKLSSSKAKLSPSFYLCVLTLHTVLLVGEVHFTHGHLAAFVNSEGKLNSGRIIRGHKLSQSSNHHESINEIPPFEQDTYGYTDQNNQKKNYGRPGHESQSWRIPSALGESSVESPEHISGDEYFDDDTGDKSIYPIPYVSAQALGNLPLFFKHLQHNMMALQKEQEEAENLLNSSEQQGSKVRWQPPASGLINSDRYHRHNTRNFFESPNNQGTLMRRAVGEGNYNPGWKYTRLGLGRKRR